MIDLLIENSWIAAMVWGVLYICDHALTRILASLHKSLPDVHQTITHQGGLELNPFIEQEVKQMRWFTPRFMISFALIFLLIVFIGLDTNKLTFEIVIGAFILEWIYLDLVHFQNLLGFRDMKNPHRAKGKIELSYWFSQRTAAYHLLSFALLYLIIALITFRLFFVGGAISCSLLALRQFSLADRKFPAQPSDSATTSIDKSQGEP